MHGACSCACNDQPGPSASDGVLTTCVSVILLIRLPGVGGVLTIGSGLMSGDRPAGSIMERVRLAAPGAPKGDATPPPAPKLVLTAAGAAGFGAGDAGDAAAGDAAAAAAVLLPLVLGAAGGSATAAADATGRAEVEVSSGSPNSVSNLSRMSILLPSICSLSRATSRFTCTAASLKGSVRPATGCMEAAARHWQGSGRTSMQGTGIVDVSDPHTHQTEISHGKHCAAAESASHEA